MMLYEVGRRQTEDVPLCSKNSAGEELRAPALDLMAINYLFVTKLPVSEVARQMSIMGLRSMTTMGYELDFFADQALKNLELVRNESGCTLAYPSKSEQKTSPKPPPLLRSLDEGVRSVLGKGENHRGKHGMRKYVMANKRGIASVV